MLTRRLIVLGLSTVLGIVATYLVVLLISFTQRNVTPAYYGVEYFALTALFLGAMFLVWIDYFMKTNLLPK